MSNWTDNFANPPIIATENPLPVSSPVKPRIVRLTRRTLSLITLHPWTLEQVSRWIVIKALARELQLKPPQLALGRPASVKRCFLGLQF